MKFGLGFRKKLTGAELAVRIIQGAAILASLFTAVLPGYLGLMKGGNILSAAFELGVSSLPRVWALALSWAYRLTSSEIVLHFALLVLALAFGLAMGALLKAKPKTALVTRAVFAALLAGDIVVRIIPLKINSVFPRAFSVIGAAVCVCCLVLTLLDIIASRRGAQSGSEDSAA